MLENVVDLLVLYGSETWVMNARVKRRRKVFDMKCLRRALRMSIMDEIRNREERERNRVVETRIVVEPSVQK